MRRYIILLALVCSLPVLSYSAEADEKRYWDIFPSGQIYNGVRLRSGWDYNFEVYSWLRPAVNQPTRGVVQLLVYAELTVDGQEETGIVDIRLGPDNEILSVSVPIMTGDEVVMPDGSFEVIRSISAFSDVAHSALGERVATIVSTDQHDNFAVLSTGIGFDLQGFCAVEEGYGAGSVGISESGVFCVESSGPWFDIEESLKFFPYSGPDYVLPDNPTVLFQTGDTIDDIQATPLPVGRISHSAFVAENLIATIVRAGGGPYIALTDTESQGVVGIREFVNADEEIARLEENTIDSYPAFASAELPDGGLWVFLLSWLTDQAGTEPPYYGVLGIELGSDDTSVPEGSSAIPTIESSALRDRILRMSASLGFGESGEKVRPYTLFQTQQTLAAYADKKGGIKLSGSLDGQSALSPGLNMFRFLRYAPPGTNPVEEIIEAIKLFGDSDPTLSELTSDGTPFKLNPTWRAGSIRRLLVRTGDLPGSLGASLALLKEQLGNNWEHRHNQTAPVIDAALTDCRNTSADIDWTMVGGDAPDFSRLWFETRYDEQNNLGITLQPSMDRLEVSDVELLPVDSSITNRLSDFGNGIVLGEIPCIDALGAYALGLQFNPMTLPIEATVTSLTPTNDLTLGNYSLINSEGETATISLRGDGSLGGDITGTWQVGKNGSLTMEMISEGSPQEEHNFEDTLAAANRRFQGLEYEDTTHNMRLEKERRDRYQYDGRIIVQVHDEFEVIGRRRLQFTRVSNRSAFLYDASGNRERRGDISIMPGACNGGTDDGIATRYSYSEEHQLIRRDIEINDVYNGARRVISIPAESLYSNYDRTYRCLSDSPP